MLKISTSKLGLVSLVALQVAFTACKKAEVYKPIPSLSVSSNTMTVGATGTNSALQILGTVKWTAASDQAWLKIPRAKGANDAWLIVTADSNFTADKKTGKITITPEDGVDPFEVAVTQTAGVVPVVSISTSDGRLDSLTFRSNSFSISLGNSLDQKLTVTSDQTWLKVTTNSTSDYTSVEVEENETSSNRTAKITVKNKLGDVIKEFNVTQVFDQFTSLFFGVNWKLSKVTTGTGTTLTLENCQQDDVYKFSRPAQGSSNGTMTRANANPGGGSCPTDVDNGSFSLSTPSSGDYEIYCSMFYDIINSSSYLYSSSISSTKLVLKNSNGSRLYEFVKQ